MTVAPRPGATDFVHVVETEDAGRLLRLGLAVLAAASMGRSCTVLLLAGPLRHLANGTPGSPPATPVGVASVLARLPAPWDALREAASLAPVVTCTCDTELALADLDRPPAHCELVSLPALWREASGRSVVVW